MNSVSTVTKLGFFEFGDDGVEFSLGSNYMHVNSSTKRNGVISISAGEASVKLATGSLAF